MSELTDLGLAEAKCGLLAGEFSATELAEACLIAADRAGALNTLITSTPEKTREMSAISERRIAAGEARNLEGLPIAVKDQFCTEGIRTTAASRILENFVPTYESTVSAKLWDAGAVLCGKTNLDEFAMGSSTENSAFGPTENPWRAGDGKPRVPGGSSGGSAAAVAGRIVPGALGTDTGGSIRQPAAFCGVVGLKPTYGRCSRWGVIAFASSLDQPGPIARSVADTALLLSVIAGFDPKDSTSVDIPVPDYCGAITGDVRQLKVGVPEEYRVDDMPTEMEKAWRQAANWLRDAGAEVRSVSLPLTKYALPSYYIIAPAEASSNLARYDGVRYGLRIPGDNLTGMYEKTRAEGFGAEVQRRILIGTYVLSAGYYDAYYLKAQKVRSRIAADFRDVFGQVDMLLTPATPTPAFTQGEKIDDRVGMFLNDVFTVPASMAGLPGLTLPVTRTTDGLPLGVQLIAPAFREETLFCAAGVLEEAASFNWRPDPWWMR